jgi:hypothetical protein
MLYCIGLDGLSVLCPTRVPSDSPVEVDGKMVERVEAATSPFPARQARKSIKEFDECLP